MRTMRQSRLMDWAEWSYQTTIRRFLMKKALMVICIGMLVLPVIGCKDKYESAVEDQLDMMEEMTEILKDVKDEESAKAAKADLEDVASRMQALAKEMEAMEKPSAEKEKELKEKYEKRMGEVMGNFMKEAMRVGMDPKLNKELGDAMKKAKSAG